MDDLEKVLNNDVVYYIKNCTVDEIKKDTLALLDYFEEHRKSPIEPSGGKQYSIWVQYMVHYTKNVKPIEMEFLKMCRDISESTSFDLLQELYPKVKNLFDTWYSLRRKYQFSGHYNMGV
jgi:hypothetical protein